MYCFNFFRNQLWQHLINYNSLRTMNMCLLEVAMCEKCRSSNFQLEEGESKKFENCRKEGVGLKNFRTGGGLPIWGWGGTFAGGSVHHYMKCNFDLPNDYFHCAKFRKSSYSRSRVMTMHHFWTQYGPFAPNKFFWKIIIILIYLLAPFIVQNLKKILPADPELWGCAIFGPKMTHFPKWEFFQKTC